MEHQILISHLVSVVVVVLSFLAVLASAKFLPESLFVSLYTFKNFNHTFLFLCAAAISLVCKLLIVLPCRNMATGLGWPLTVISKSLF